MIEEKHVLKISGDLGVGAQQVVAAAGILDEGATIPFIAR
jgi:transcriptional accessory protein Tex/SPT6